MKLLVCSDSHGNQFALERAIQQQADAQIILFLGDGAKEAHAVRNALSSGKTFLCVRGNNDPTAFAPENGLLTVQKHKIFYTHGHNYGVKYDLYRITCAAKSQGASLLLFGHTHQPLITYDDGLYLMNPGALCPSWGAKAGYGVVEITPAGIFLNRVELK